MEVIALTIGYLLFQFDIALIKKRALSIFESVFRFANWQIFLLSFLLLLSIVKISVDSFVIVEIVFVFLLTIYFLRRSQFFALVNSSEQYAVIEDENLALAFSVLPLILLWALGMVLVSIVSEILQKFFHWSLDELSSLLILSEISVLLLVILIYQAVRRLKSLKLFEVFGLQTHRLGWIKIWVLPAGFAIGYAVLTSWLLEARPIQPLTPLQDILNSTSSLGVLLFFAATAILTAPFFEEIIFRGFLFSLMQRFKGSVFAIIFVALIFGALHVEQYWGDWDAILVVSLFGLSLTLFRAWSGSAVPGMIAHYVYNTSLIILPIATILLSNPLYLDYQVNYYLLTNVQKQERLLKSIEQYPQFTNAYNDLAWLYSEQNIKLDHALELIDKALILEPENDAFLDTKAEVLFKMGRVNQAIAIEQCLIQKYPSDSYFRQQLKKFTDVSE